MKRTTGLRSHWLGSCLGIAAGLAMLLSGCGDGSADDQEISKKSSALIVPAPNYVNAGPKTLTDSNNNSVTAWNWIKCASNQVLVGFYGGSKGLCATLPSGTSLLSTRIDYPGTGSNHTTIFQNTGYDMHGCPSGSFIQGITTSGNNEWLYCATFNFGYSLGPILDQGCCGGPTTSANTYGLSNPNMHVCQAMWNPNLGKYEAAAMVGIHRGQNNFGCAY